MPVKLIELKGASECFVKKQEDFPRSISSRDHEGNVEFSKQIMVKDDNTKGYNQCIDDHQNVSISGDVEQLANILFEQNKITSMHWINLNEFSKNKWRQDAIGIITSMRSWVKLEKI